MGFRRALRQVRIRAEVNGREYDATATVDSEFDDNPIGNAQATMGNAYGLPPRDWGSVRIKKIADVGAANDWKA